MNTSKYIDSTKCASCGLCCKSFQIGYSKQSDKEMLSEVERFKLLDTDLIQVHEDSTGFWVEFKIPCKHLKINDNGYYCEIYNLERPKLCENYPYENTHDCPNKIVTK
ncbi:MAG: YkgJ family cysteine cluster protein [Candidatus Woesearchaeota archaeon]